MGWCKTIFAVVAISSIVMCWLAHRKRSRKPDVHIRTLLPSEWTTLRDGRILSVCESAAAFGMTEPMVADEIAKSDLSWQQQASSAIWFAGWLGDEIVALASSRLSPSPRHPNARSWLLSSIWVRAKNRRCGIATQLLHAITSAARSDQVSILRLWVVEENRDAADIYRKAGFVETGRREARSPANPDVFILEFSRSNNASSIHAPFSLIK
jgi:GNAT superfamily N-acetyltransferase